VISSGVYFTLVVTALLSVILNRKKIKGFIYVSLFFVFGLITDLLNSVEYREWIYHIYHASEYFLAGAAITANLIKSKGTKSLFYKTIPVMFVVFSVGAYLDGIDNMSIINCCFASSLTVLYCLYYLKEKYQPPFKTRLSSDAFFWVVLAWLIYFTGLYLALVYENENFQLSKTLRYIVYYLNYAINYCFYLLIIFGTNYWRIFRT